MVIPSSLRPGHFADLIAVLVGKELKVRYRGTSFGILWSLANPLAFAAVLYVAFRKVFQVEIENYPLFILAALLPWQWLSTSLTSAAPLFLANAPLLKKLPFPRHALCLAVSISDMIHFLVTIPLFAVLYFASTGRPPGSVWLVGVPLLVGIQLVTCIGAVILISTANALFRDLEQLVRVLLTLLFYATPILFPASMVPKELSFLLYLNPLAPLMVAWRSLLVESQLDLFSLIAALYAAILLALAIRVYRAMSWRLPEVV